MRARAHTHEPAKTIKDIQNNTAQHIGTPLGMAPPWQFATASGCATSCHAAAFCSQLQAETRLTRTFWEKSKGLIGEAAHSPLNRLLKKKDHQKLFGQSQKQYAGTTQDDKHNK